MVSAGKPKHVLAVQPVGRAYRDRVSVRATALRIKKATERYAVQLRKIARHIDDIVKGFDAASPEGRSLMQNHLRRYAETLDHWAASTADGMLARASEADKERWRRNAQAMSRSLQREIQSADVAPAMARMRVDQVRLIKSLPIEAAERVAGLVREGLTKGARAETIAARIHETGLVTRSRADTIARTEVGRAATTLQAARAKSVGSTHFRWVSVGDRNVRASHRKLNGTVHRWDEPPVCDAPDIRALPGCVFNCRCVAAPIID